MSFRAISIGYFVKPEKKLNPLFSLDSKVILHFNPSYQGRTGAGRRTGAGTR